MKPPEAYFSIRTEGNGTSYEWQDKGRSFVAGVIGIIFLIILFLKTYVDKELPYYIFLSTLLLVLAVFAFLWMNDRYRLTLDQEGIFLSKGLSLYFGGGLGARYLKKDFKALYTRSTSNFSNFDFGSDSKIIWLQLNDGRNLRLTNALVNEHADFLIHKMKVFFTFTARPGGVELKFGAKVWLASLLIIVGGTLAPRLMEVGEWPTENLTNSLRIATGILGMSFMFWVVTSTDLIFKEGELLQRQKILMFLVCLVPTLLILGFLYLT